MFLAEFSKLGAGKSSFKLFGGRKPNSHAWPPAISPAPRPAAGCPGDCPAIYDLQFFLNLCKIMLDIYGNIYIIVNVINNHTPNRHGWTTTGTRGAGTPGQARTGGATHPAKQISAVALRYRAAKKRPHNPTTDRERTTQGRHRYYSTASAELQGGNKNGNLR